MIYILQQIVRHGCREWNDVRKKIVEGNKNYTYDYDCRNGLIMMGRGMEE